MHPRAWSTVFAGAALAAALTLAMPAPAAAVSRERIERGAWSLAGPWLGELWSSVTAAINWGVDPNGSPVPDEERPEPAGDIGLGIDPDG